MRKTILIVAIIAVAGAAGYGYYVYNRKAAPPTVTTAKVTRGDIADTVGATGQLQAVTTVQVGTQVSGTVQELNADFNSLVRKGQVIARLDPSLFQTQIEQARANLTRAQADLERLRVGVDDARTKLNRAQELSAKQLIAQTDLEAAQVAVRSADAQLRSQQAAVTQAQASLQQNQVNLEHTIIEAPIDGLVISRNVDVGQTVAASMSAPTLFVLAADLTKMQVIASLDESDVGRIRPGQVVRFRVDAYPNQEFLGSVTQVRLQPTTVQNVVTYATVIDVPNPELKLKPGMTANVNIEIAASTDVLRVPNAALRFRPTAEIFQALGQTPPAGGGGFGGRGGRGRTGTGGTTPPATAPSGTESTAKAPTSSQKAPTAAKPAAPKPAAAPAPNAPAANTEGRGGRGGGRGNFQERMASMTPEERQAFLERMRARGFDPEAATAGRASGAGGAGGQGAAAQGAGGQGAARATAAAPPKAAAAQAAHPAATTIDALFAPLPPTESFGQVWLFQDGKLSRVAVHLGISDGQQTQLLDGDLKEGQDLVSNITTAAQRASTTAGAAPGIFGNQGRGFPGGGFPGGGGGGGNRGAAPARGGR